MDTYEKKYKEIIEKFREALAPKNGCEISGLTRDCVEEILPELKESEDEKIIKTIKCCLRYCNGGQEDYTLYNDDYDKCISWLERQGEQKPVNKQDYSGLDGFERAIHRGFLCAGVENVPVTIIKETAQDCLSHIAQKPAEWSEDDIHNIQDIDAVLFYDRLLLKDKCIKLRSWLENLKNRVKPKQEWSEKDGEMLGRVDDSLHYYQTKLREEKSYEAADMVREELSWLKSLRPQNRWKPSERQMWAIENAQMLLCGTEYNVAVCSLIEDLKKLKQ